MKCNFIFYVRDQVASTFFYKNVLGQDPALNVPGMTEFHLLPGCTLGLMPEKGIKRLLGDAIPDPEDGQGIARAEAYLVVEDPEKYIDRAIRAGGRLLSPLKNRDWGDSAGYVADLDGHVLAFASRN